MTMELLPSFFQTGGLAILIMLSCFLPFCDSLRLLLNYPNGTVTSFDLIKEYVCSTHNELHTLLEINMELFMYVLLIIFAIRYLVVPMVQRVDNILERVYQSVHNLALLSCDAIHQFVNGYITLPARLSSLEAILAKKACVTVEIGSSRRAKLLRRQLKCAKRHLSKRAIEAAHNTVTIANLTAENCATLDIIPTLVAFWTKTPEGIRSKVQRYAHIDAQLKQLHATHYTSNEQYRHLYEQTALSFDAFEKHYTELRAASENAIELEDKWIVEKGRSTKLEEQLGEAVEDAEDYHESLKTKTEENINLVKKIYDLATHDPSLEKVAPCLGDSVILMQTSLCDLQKENSDYQELITRLQSNESDLQKQLLESKEASKECLRQNNERLTNMATAQAEALKAKDNEIAALEQQLAERQSTQNQQTTDDLDRFATTVAQKDKVIAASRDENTILQQQLADCKTLVENNAFDARNQIATVVTEKNAEMEQIRQQALDQSASSEQIASYLQAELVKLRKQASDYQAMRKQNTADVLSDISVENAEKEDELEKIRSEKFALAAKVAIMEKLHKETFESSSSQILSVTTSEAVSIAPQRIDSKAQTATEEVLKLTKQLTDKNAYLETAYAELHSIKREWSKMYVLVQDSSDNWVTIGRRLGKTKFDCLHQIEEMRYGDPEMRPKTGLNDGRLDTAMEIRLAGYEMRVWSEHFCEFVKAYAKSVSKAHPEIKQWAEKFGSSSTTSVPLSTPVVASTASPTQPAMNTKTPLVSKYSMNTTPKVSPSASVASNATSSSAKMVIPAPLAAVSAASASSSAATTSANNKGASGSITTFKVAPGGSSSACADDGGRSDTASSVTPSSTSASRTQESASNDTSTTAESVANRNKTPGLAKSRYASMPADTASYPRPNTRKALESASPALTNTKGLVGSFQINNAGSKTTPIFSLPPTMFKPKETSIQFGQPDDAWTPPSTAAPMVFQGSKVSKPPAPARIQSKQASQVRKKATLPAKKLVANSDSNNERSAPGPAVTPTPKPATTPSAARGKKQVTSMDASRWASKM